jgi:hypothetical protein
MKYRKTQLPLCSNQPYPMTLWLAARGGSQEAELGWARGVGCRARWVRGAQHRAGRAAEPTSGGWICFIHRKKSFFPRAPFSSTLGAFGNSLFIILLILSICFHFKLPSSKIEQENRFSLPLFVCLL